MRTVGGRQWGGASVLRSKSEYVLINFVKVNYLLIGIVVGSLLLLVFVYPQSVNKYVSVPNVPFRLGLDLLGGTHLVYQADLSKSENKSDAMQGVRDVIERRVNFFGVAEPLVQKHL